MRYYLPSIILRSLVCVLLLAALGSCSLYRKIHHPYRLPTPKPSPEYIAQQKAKKEAEKKRNELAAANSATKKKKGDATEEAATDVSVPSNNDAAAATSSTADIKDSVYPERPTVRYDKHEMMKKPKLMRRRRHKHRKGFHPIESVRNFFKYGFHAKPNYDPDHKPAPKPSADPDATPDAAPAPEGKP